jgi:two-component system, NtrC family, sensor histidine kinase HydH
LSEMAEYQSFHGIQSPVLVVRGEHILHANPALLTLLGRRLEEVRGAPLSRVLTRCEAEAFGPLPGELWVRMNTKEARERTYRVSRGEGLRPSDTVWMLLDAEGEESTRRLTESLAQTAEALVRCRDEPTVLKVTVEALRQRDFYVMVMVREERCIRFGPHAQAPALVAACERVYGRAFTDIRVPLTALPHIEELWLRRRSTFTPHFQRLFDHVPASEPLSRVAETVGALRALDAPIFVEGEPYGALCVQSRTLTPTSAATLELFARHVGGALENVRHHRRAEERLVELSRLQSELLAQERLTVLGEAAGVVAHEVRNPLGAILNAAAVLKREKLGPVGRSAVEMLEEEATRLDLMVRDLLDVVRPLEPRPRPLHPGELVRRTLEALRQRRQLGTLQVSLHEASELPSLQGDEFLLQLALENLLRNAVQVCPPHSRVQVSVEPDPQGVLLCVEDEGPGIAPADAQRVFEPFFTTRATGTGLGLAVVRRVVQAHGGAVSVGPRPGGGARFELRLPLHLEARPLALRASESRRE